MTRSRIPAAFAAVALIGVSIFGGALAANAVAQAPVIVTPLTDTTSTDLNPDISGTIANPGETQVITVSVTNAAGTGTYCVATIPYTDTNWTCGDTAENFGLQYGENTFTATATDATDPGTPGPVSNSVVVTVGGTQPTTIYNPEPNATVHDSTPLFEGTGPVLGTVRVYVNGEQELCQGDVGIDGFWSCESTIAFPEGGPYPIAATATLITGGFGEGFYGPEDMFYTPPPPTPALIAPLGGTTYDGTQFFSGSIPVSSDGVEVIVYAAGDTPTEICSVTVPGGDGIWACPGTLLVGSQDYYAVAYPNVEVVDTDNPSGSSNGVTIEYIDTVPLPAMNYTLGAASIGITADGVPGSEAVVEFYSVDTTGGGGEGGGWGFNLIANCPTNEGGEGGETFEPVPVSCSFADLAPGIYNAYAQQRIEGVYSDHQDDYILIPTTPTFGASLQGTNGVVFSGSGTPGYQISVQNLGGQPMCTAIVSAGENWQCTLSGEAPGPHSYRAVQQSTGFVADPGYEGTFTSLQGYSAYTASVIVSVPTPPAPPAPPAPEPSVTPTPTPTPTATPVPLVWTFTAGGGEYSPGDSTDLVGSDLPPGSAVSAEFHSTPVALGSTTVGADGKFLLHVTIPEDAEAGLHHFVVSVTPPGGVASVVEQPVTIKAHGGVIVTYPPKKPVTGTLTTTGGAAVGSERNDPAAPSTLTTSIPSISTILFSNPIVIGGAALAGLALLLLVALPAELLNSTISEQYPRFAKVLPKATWTERLRAWFERTPVIGGLGLTLLAALIFGFTDPGFGFDAVTLRMVVACALALFVVGYLASTISGAIIRRRWGLATVMELKPLGLILAIIGVVISRLIDFAPGFMLGLILGIAVVGNTTLAQRAKTTLVQAGVVFTLALLGWVAYSVLSATTTPDSFLTALAFDTSVAITTEGLTALFVGMLPFRFLDGESIFQYNKVLWAACYIAAAAAFIAIVVPNSYGELDTNVWTWATVVGIFAILALGVWVYFRFFAPPLEEDEEEVEPEKVDA